MKKMIFFLLAASGFILIWIIILRLLGFKFNKDYFSYNRNQCILNQQREVEGCVFWSRNDKLRDKDWKNQFAFDFAHCVKYKNVPFPASLDEMGDPRCELEAFYAQKREENWAYLTSKEHDLFFNDCANQFCPTERLLN